MPFFKQRVLTYWIAFIAYTTVIFLQIPYSRPLVTYLRQQNLLTISVTSAFVIVLVILLIFFLKFLRNNNFHFSKRRLVFLTLFATAYAVLLSSFSLPEERLHFLEYGLLAWLLRSALARHCSIYWQYTLAIVATAIIGLIDEVVQYFVPSRVYDIRDVLMNASAGLLALIIDEGLHNRLQRYRVASQPPPE